MEADFLTAISEAAEAVPGPRLIPWPGTPSGVREFASFAEWHNAISDLDLNEAIPLIVRGKYERARKLYLIGWIDADLIKAGEMIAYTALETAMRDRYGHRRWRNRKVEFDGKQLQTRAPAPLAEYLAYMVFDDGLTDDKLPIVQRYGGSVIGSLTGETKPSLADRRNDLAHGYPFDGFPVSGLLELIRDLIEYAYRDLTRESRAMMSSGP